MKEIIIIGAGGLGRDIQWLIERINEKEEIWKIKGYIDDGIEVGTEINGYYVLGGIDVLLEMQEEISVVCAIGISNVRKKVIEKIIHKDNINFPNLIDPSVHMSKYVKLGKGNIICAGTIISVNITINDFIILNAHCTIGHDVVLKSFVIAYPSATISGNVYIDECTEIGTGSQIIQGKKICGGTIIGAGSVVVRDIDSAGTYVGVPAKAVRLKDK